MSTFRSGAQIISKISKTQGHGLLHGLNYRNCQQTAEWSNKLTQISRIESTQLAPNHRRFRSWFSLPGREELPPPPKTVLPEKCPPPKNDLPWIPFFNIKETYHERKCKKHETLDNQGRQTQVKQQNILLIIADGLYDPIICQNTQLSPLLLEVQIFGLKLRHLHQHQALLPNTRHTSCVSYYKLKEDKHKIIQKHIFKSKDAYDKHAQPPNQLSCINKGQQPKCTFHKYKKRNQQNSKYKAVDLVDDKSFIASHLPGQSLKSPSVTHRKEPLQTRPKLLPRNITIQYEHHRKKDATNETEISTGQSAKYDIKENFCSSKNQSNKNLCKETKSDIEKTKIIECLKETKGSSNQAKSLIECQIEGKKISVSVPNEVQVKNTNRMETVSQERKTDLSSHATQQGISSDDISKKDHMGTHNEDIEHKLPNACTKEQDMGKDNLISSAWKLNKSQTKDTEFLFKINSCSAMLESCKEGLIMNNEMIMKRMLNIMVDYMNISLEQSTKFINTQQINCLPINLKTYERSSCSKPMRKHYLLHSDKTKSLFVTGGTACSLMYYPKLTYSTMLSNIQINYLLKSASKMDKMCKSRFHEEKSQILCKKDDSVDLKTDENKPLSKTDSKSNCKGPVNPVYVVFICGSVFGFGVGFFSCFLIVISAIINSRS